MSNLIGQRVGQYEIIALLGKGGMAVVYRARQSSIGRDVAIKVIKPDLAETEEFEKRFQREAEAIASLSHPFILKVFDYGQQGDQVYLVTELLKGGSLADAIRKEPLSPESAGRTLDQIASALDYAHERGIIHRDLKPANVLLDEKGNAHLTDFGIAKILSENNTLTQSGAAIGTPAYMSPEQWQGTALDARADVYALGVVLFEMLTGKLPFQADTAYSMMHLHVNEPIPSIRQVRPDLPAAVETIINKALAKNREERFASAGELAAAYHAALLDKSVPLARTDSTEKVALMDGETVLRKPEAPSRTLPLGIGGLVILLAVLGGIVFVVNRQALINASSTPTSIAALAPTSLPTSTRSAATLTLSPSLMPTETLPSPTLTFTASPTKTFTATPTPVAPTNTPFPPTETLIPATPTQMSTATFAPGPVISAANADQVQLLYSIYAGVKVASIAFSPDGALLAFGRGDHIVSVWDLRANAFKARFSGLTNVVISVAFSPDGKLLAAGDGFGQLRLWDTTTGQETVPLKGHTGIVSKVLFSPDGKTLFTGSWDRTIRFWDVNTGNLLATLQSPSPVYGLALSPDGTLLASANQDNAVRFWDVRQHNVVAVLQGHENYVEVVAFSPDGTLLASGGHDSTVRLWDVPTRKQKAILRGHLDTVGALAFSPDGSLIASGGYDFTAHIWDVNSGRELTVFKGHTDQIWAVAFSPDGKLFATASLDGRIHIGSVPATSP